MGKKYIKNTEKPVQKYRFAVQVFFTLLCIWIGIEFYMFVGYLESGGASGSFSRPEGVDGFLPISSLMNVYYFFLTGEIHQAHPAGFFIFMAIIAVSFVFGKAFCSWICPVGLLSELIGDFGEKIEKKLFKKKIKLPAIFDYPLRGIKYLLLFFLVYVIFFNMTAFSLRVFLDSPYNVLSDVKMFYFFADISKFSLIVISVLFGLSVLIRNFWCRYLCPYGALLGVFSLLSPNKIKRNEISCIDCSLCAKACPSNIKVDKVNHVVSDECSTCMSCVDACPVKDTLQLTSIAGRKKIDKRYVFAGVIVIYMIITGIGMATGNWESKVPESAYHEYFKNIDNLGHPRTTSEMKKLENKAETGEKNESKFQKGIKLQKAH